MNIIVILAAGKGKRFESSIPKQFCRVHGRMIIDYVIEAAEASRLADKILITVAHPAPNLRHELVTGGETRNQSLKNSLDYIHEYCPDCRRVIICDAVRPMITGELLDEYFRLLDSHDAVVTTREITDSLGCRHAHAVDREDYYLMQSPEAFRFDLLYANFKADCPLSEAAHQLPPNSDIFLRGGFTANIKITHPEDIPCFEAMLSRRKVEELTLAPRLTDYLRERFRRDTVSDWLNELGANTRYLFRRWEILSWKVIHDTHFGVVLSAESARYGDCVIKIVPPFIQRFEQERDFYLVADPVCTCTLLDYDNAASALLLERCGKFRASTEELRDFFLRSQGIETELETFNDYEAILRGKLNEPSAYRTELIAEHVRRANRLYRETFSGEKLLIHGDTHRFNLLRRNNAIAAVDPIGYYAPVEINATRFIGTELVEHTMSYDGLRALFDGVFERRRLTRALYIDTVFRMHNTLTENTDHVLCDRWLEILDDLTRREGDLL